MPPNVLPPTLSGSRRDTGIAMAIEWREVLSLQDGLLDADHQELIASINTIEPLLASEQPSSDLRVAVAQLRQHSAEHFAREESVMIDLGYAKYALHRKAHRDLIEKLRLCTQPIMQMDKHRPSATDKLPREIREGLKVMLRYWLVDHILTLDVQLKPLLAQRPRSHAQWEAFARSARQPGQP